MLPTCFQRCPVELFLLGIKSCRTNETYHLDKMVSKTSIILALCLVSVYSAPFFKEDDGRKMPRMPVQDESKITDQQDTNNQPSENTGTSNNPGSGDTGTSNSQGSGNTGNSEDQQSGSTGASNNQGSENNGTAGGQRSGNTENSGSQQSGNTGNSTNQESSSTSTSVSSSTVTAEYVPPTMPQVLEKSCFDKLTTTSDKVSQLAERLKHESEQLDPNPVKDQVIKCSLIGFPYDRDILPEVREQCGDAEANKLRDDLNAYFDRHSCTNAIRFTR
ncbi:hypothetical protein L5515_016352 [Caenorhabditis briggsae]|uniref:Uncharacterized protein n=1 Tax=Caenorhabditis briggsae TaxID=6238 RepID=A0AAE9JR59_CAEBR|nr:hypothetical protein L5515_016352 [Caenorhabditis briggsae]